jgi:hypothetical protein
MDFIKPDFSEEVSPPKPGVYRARIATAESRIGKTYGTPFINWKLDVLGERGIFTNYHSTPISGKGAGMFRQLMEAIDPDYNGGAVDPRNIIGKTIMVELVPEMRNGQKTGYLRVQDVMRDTNINKFPEAREPGSDDANGDFGGDVGF